MTSTTATLATHRSVEENTTTEARRVWTVGVVAGFAASVATTLVAALAKSVDVPLQIDGEPIPLAGFAQLTFVCAALGIGLAAALARRADRPRVMFVRTTVALTVVSIVPDVLIDADTATRIVLAATHLIAAAIVIPALARRLEP